MSKSHSTELPVRDRWREHAASTSSGSNDEARAGALFRSAVIEHPLTSAALTAIHERLRDRRPTAPRPLFVRVAALVVLLVAGSGVVVSATLLHRWSTAGDAARPVPLAPEPARGKHAVHVAAGGSAPIAPPVMAPPAPAAPVEHAHRRPQVTAPIDDSADVAPPPAEAPPGPSAIAEEASLVGTAIRALRDEGDAAGALALLDQHDARFGTGPLVDEARTTRVEALLHLGHHTQALVLLDAETLEPLGRERESLVTRGELRADAGRVRDALGDFDALLARAPATDGLTERALYGRAACLARLGDADGARAGLEDYLARFPDGRFSSRARTTIDR